MVIVSSLNILTVVLSLKGSYDLGDDSMDLAEWGTSIDGKLVVDPIVHIELERVGEREEFLRGWEYRPVQALGISTRKERLSNPAHDRLPTSPHLGKASSNSTRSIASKTSKQFQANLFSSCRQHQAHAQTITELPIRDTPDEPSP